MATKEDILEQIVGEFWIHRGYFVQHNIKFLPRRDHPDFVSIKDSNHSDIDVIGFHPRREGAGKVVAVSCKSWQAGFNPASEIRAITDEKIKRGRLAWQGFRELVVPKWSEAFVQAVENATGSPSFTYVLAVSKVAGDRTLWQNHQPFRDALGGNPIEIWTFKDMMLEIQAVLKTTLAATEVGRMLQMLKAAGVHIEAD